MADAEHRMTRDYPLYDRARDRVVKNNSKLSVQWRVKNEVKRYTNRLGSMGEALEKEVRGKPGLLFCGFKVWLLKDKDSQETKPQNTTLGFPFKKNAQVWDTEDNVSLAFPDGCFLDLLFIQVKTIEDPQC